MIATFMKSPLPNTLAVLTLGALIVSWLISIILSMGDTSVRTEKGWFAWLLPLFSVLGLPATWDLLQTKGMTFFFAAIVFLVFILNILIPVLKLLGKLPAISIADWYKWTVPLSVIGGLTVAGYLTFVEATGTPVVCGPSLHGCIDVQNSRYAVLFGILPVGMLGLAGYIGIVVSWLAWQYGPRSIQRMAVLALWGMCVFGVLFSAYLTFLEPFVIGATCMWCISSAVLMIILLLVSTPSAQEAMAGE
ncbi:MAG: vitamin K epoxide reductase family protein [Anaerolineales bacterium]